MMSPSSSKGSGRASSPLTSPPNSDSDDKIMADPYKTGPPKRVRKPTPKQVELNSINVQTTRTPSKDHIEQHEQEANELSDVTVQRTNGNHANGKQANGRQPRGKRVPRKHPRGKQPDGQTLPKKRPRPSSPEFVDHGSDYEPAPEDEIQVSPKEPKRSYLSAFPNAVPTPAKKPVIKFKSKRWTPDYVTQNTRSPLANVDLRELLSHPKAWSLLSLEDKKEILAHFPDNKHILKPGTDEAAPNIESLRNDDNFRHDTTQYTEKLREGMHDPGWLEAALDAHGNRIAGNMDEYVYRNLESNYALKIPDKYKPPHLRQPESPKCERGQSAEADELAGSPDDYGLKGKKSSPVQPTSKDSPADSTKGVTSDLNEMQVDVYTT